MAEDGIQEVLGAAVQEEAPEAHHVLNDVILSQLVKEVDDDKARFTRRPLTPEERTQKLERIRNHYKART